MVRQRSQKLKSESRMVNPSLCTLEPSGERESLHLREREKERERERERERRVVKSSMESRAFENRVVKSSMETRFREQL